MNIGRKDRNVAVALSLALGALAGCEDSLDGGFADASRFDTEPTFDATAGTETATTNDSSATETAVSDIRGETIGALTSLKADPDYLVPGNISAKSEVAVFRSTVAWVETPPDGGAAFLAVWNVRGGDEVRAFVVPHLTRPRALALSDELLVYVDDRYGDPDVFAVDLATGEGVTVVATRGAQEEPAVSGRRVAWADCRACVTGDEGTGWEIFERVVGGAAPTTESLVTSEGPAVADRRPAFGALGGREVLAWIRGRAELRARGESGSDVVLDVSSEIAEGMEVGWLAVADHRLAWRSRPVIVNPDPMIVNPDPMWPSDVFATEVADGAQGATTRLTRHGEVRAAIDGAVRAAGARLGWLASSPADNAVSIVEADGGTTSSLVEPGIVGFGLGPDIVAFIAPRADNAGLPDLWVRAPNL